MFRPDLLGYICQQFLPGWVSDGRRKTERGVKAHPDVYGVSLMSPEGTSRDFFRKTIHFR